ncbi:4-diphosphocytidyl-2-methyl-D-erythritol synthase [Mycolicibacterium chubuense NBB4]|uniref:4-diphosphocytidyl-2-methyl-D-erythritol synthase n=1 Tax=Mycolicibacterium chubuense (strain NBB4) TaxID=710421 RepID=I4BLY8_MYCCN|nr:2-C-methyl-D-erythritol 4-phosphate cytidylyltransferase [Mycolicibacterium chubuense]AFM18295.1 4-diphosphocytidyl-2-methyl-D-erythritol synthase [Mycolicibacterium chubuense NBB4]
MSLTAILPVPVCFADRPDAVFTPVAGQAPLVRAVRTLESSAQVLVAAAAPLADAVRETLDSQSFSRVRVVVAAPRGERAECVAAALRVVDGPYVLVHDLEWPVFGADTAHRIAEALRGGAVAVVPAQPVTDSVKAVDEQGRLLATVDRAQLRTVQYPRGFDVTVLSALSARAGSGSFDEFEVALSEGVAVTLIDGDPAALHVELPRDGRYLAAVIASQQDDR